MIHAWILFILVLVVPSWIVFKYLLTPHPQRRHYLDFRLGFFALYNFAYSPISSRWSLNIQTIQLLFSQPQTKHSRWITLSIRGVSLSLDSTIAVGSSTIVSTRTSQSIIDWWSSSTLDWIRNSRYGMIMLQGLKSGSAIPIQWCLALLCGYLKIQLDDVSLNWVTSKRTQYRLHIASLNCQSTLFNIVYDGYNDNINETPLSAQQIYSMKQTQHMFRDKQINISIILDHPHLSVISINHGSRNWQSIMQTDSLPLTTAFTLTPDCMTLLGANIFCGIDTLKLFMLPLLQHIAYKDKTTTKSQQGSRNSQCGYTKEMKDRHNLHGYPKATYPSLKPCQGALEIGKLVVVCNSVKNSSFYSQLILADLTLTSSTTLLSGHHQQNHNLDMTVDSIIYTLADTPLSEDGDRSLNILSTSDLSIQATIRTSKNNHGGNIDSMDSLTDNTSQFVVTLNNPILAIDMAKRYLLESWVCQLSSLSSPPASQENINKDDAGFVNSMGQVLPNFDMSLVLISPKVHLQHLLPRDNQLALGMQGIFHCTSVRYLLSGEYNSSMNTPPLPSPTSSTTSLCPPPSLLSSRRKRSANLLQRIRDPSSAPSSSSSSIKSGTTSGQLHLQPLQPSESNLVYKTVFWLNIDNMRVDYWQHYQWIPWVASKHLDLAIKTDLATPLTHNKNFLIENINDMELQATMDRPMLYLCDGSLEMDPLLYWSALLNTVLSLVPQKLNSAPSVTNQDDKMLQSIPTTYIQIYRRCTASLSMLKTKVWMVALDTKATHTQRTPEGYLDNTPSHYMVTTMQFSMDTLAMDLVNQTSLLEENTSQHLGNIHLSLHQLVLSQHTTALADDDQHWGSSSDGGNDDEEMDLPMTVLAWISRLQCTLSLGYYQNDVIPILVKVDIKLRKVALRYSLGNHYAALLVIKALYHISISMKTTHSNQGINTDDDNGIKKTHGHASLIRINNVKSQLFRFDCHILLPGQDELFLRADDLSTFWRHPSTRGLRSMDDDNGSFSVTNITLLGVSPPTILFHDDGDHKKCNGKKQWEALLELDDVEWLVDSVSSPDGTLKKTTSIIMTKAVVRIPYGYVLAPVLENMVNLVKGIRELHGRLLTDSSTYYTYIGPIPRNSPIRLPTITLQCNQILIRLDDDPFEAKLRRILRVGQNEQTRRMNLESEFAKEKTRYQEQHQQQSSKLLSSASSNYSSGAQSFKSTYNPTNGNRYSQPVTTNDTADKETSAKDHIDMARRRLWTIHSESWIRNIQAYQQKETEINDQLRQADYRYRCMMDSLDAAYDDCDTEMDNDTSNESCGKNANISDLFCLEIIPLPLHAPLAQLTMAKSIMTISQQQEKQGGLFPLDETVMFVHEMGQGVPVQSNFSFLIPFNLNWQAGETLVQVRDYPLPLLHVPAATRPHDQQLDQPIYPFTNPVAWSLTGNYVIADDIGVTEGSRIINLDTSSPYSINIVRTASPTKFYSRVDYNIYSSAMSTICWSISYQPAIQDIIEILEGITPTPVDPSAKIGFWDKLRLVIHTKTKFTFSGGGDVAFVSKGTRDPYQLMGLGAGMAKLWRGNVVWYLGYQNPQQEFTQIQSDSYVLGVPDLIRGGYLSDHPASSIFFAGADSPSLCVGDNNRFLKTAIKLTGGVQMGIGCHLERTCSVGCQVCKKDGTLAGQTCRFLHFKPHHEVIFKARDFVRDTYHDAYSGFRSDFVHLSISIIKSPTSACTSDDTTANAMYLSPHFVSHFRQWYGLFGGPLSLPIRRGPLFNLLRGLDTPPLPPVKIGRHLQSLKYKIMIQPMAFGYFCMLDERRDDGVKGVGVDAIGLKFNVSHFCVDVHQRRKQQPMTVVNSPTHSSASSGTSVGRSEDELYLIKSNWPLHEVEIQLRTVDLRAVYTKNTPFAPNHHSQDNTDFINSSNKNGDNQKWIDPDDFRELGLDVDHHLIAATATSLPFAYSPCVAYVKRLDPIWVERNRHLKNTHACSMGTAKGTLDTQLDYLHQRIGLVEEQLCLHQQHLETLEMYLSKQAYSADLLEEANETISVIAKLNSRRHLLTRYMQKISQLATQGQLSNNMSTDSSNAHTNKKPVPDFDENSLKQWEHMMGRFKERYTIHNPQIIWTSAVHDIVNRWRDARAHYDIQTYNISSRATQLLRELVEKCTIHEYQQYHGHQQRSSTGGSSSSRKDNQNTTHYGLDSHAAQILLNKLIADRDHHFVVDNETNQPKSHQQHYTAPSPTTGDDIDRSIKSDGKEQGEPSDNNPRYQLNQIPDGYSAENNTLIDLWNPQVFLQGNGRQDCGILVANERVQVKQFEVIETGNSDVDTCAVKKRTVASVESVQLFVTKSGYLDKAELLLDDHYGVNLHPPPSVNINQDQQFQRILSPWIPPEMFIDDFIGQHHTSRFSRFGNDSNITGTIQYDRHNPIRSSSAYQSSSSQYQPWDDQCNSTHLHFPNFDFTADPYQYSVLYQVIGDIILFKKEPRHLERTDRLRDITFSIYANGDSPSKTLEDVVDLQTKIRHFSQLYRDYQRQIVIKSTHMGDKNNGSALLQQRCHSARQHLVTYQEALLLLMQSFKQTMDKYHHQHRSSNVNDSSNDRSSQSSPRSNYDDNNDDFGNQTIAISNIKISVKSLVWRMLQNDGSLFSQWKLTNTSYVLICNKDQSLCHTVEIDKLLVKNTSSSPVFKQVIGPYLRTLPGSSSSATTNMPDFYRHKMIYGRLVSLKPVGGIPVIQQLEINLFPLRLQLTYDFWRAFVAYLFPTVTSPKPAEAENQPTTDSPLDTNLQHHSLSSAKIQETTMVHTIKSSSSRHRQDIDSINSIPGIWYGDSATVPPSTSSPAHSSINIPDTAFSGLSAALTQPVQHSKASSVGSRRTSWALMNGSLKAPKLRKSSRSSSAHDHPDNEDDLVIMKQRASNNRTFILIKIHGAKHCLSFQGSKNIYDLQNFCFRQPNLEYRNKTWSWYDLMNALKKDFLRAAIKHSPALIKEKFTPSRLLNDSSKPSKHPLDNENITTGLNSSKTDDHEHQANIKSPTAISAHSSLSDSSASKEVIKLGTDGWFDYDSSTEDDDDEQNSVDDGGNSIHREDHQLYMLDNYLDVEDLKISTGNVANSDSLGGQTEDDDDDNELISLHSANTKDIVIGSPSSLSDSEIVLARDRRKKKHGGDVSDGIFGKTISKLLPFSRKGKQQNYRASFVDSIDNTNDEKHDGDELERLKKGKLLFGKSYRF